MLLLLFWAPEEQYELMFGWQRGVSEQGGAEGGTHTVHHGDSRHTDRPHTWQCSESAAPPHCLHTKISSWFSTLSARNTTVMTSLLTDWSVLRTHGCWMTTNKRKIPQSLFKKCPMSKLSGAEGFRFSWPPGGHQQTWQIFSDPLALWEHVQWKIVPIANPWQANYSFDPLGVCIAIGGREATHSEPQYTYGHNCFH